MALYLAHFLSILSDEAPCLSPLSLLGVPSRRWLPLHLLQDVLGDLPENLTLNQPLALNIILIQTYTCTSTVQDSNVLYYITNLQQQKVLTFHTIVNNKYHLLHFVLCILY